MWGTHKRDNLREGKSDPSVAGKSQEAHVNRKTGQEFKGLEINKFHGETSGVTGEPVIKPQGGMWRDKN